MGFPGKHGQRDGGIHTTLRSLPKDPIALTTEERQEGDFPVQEMGGRGARVHLGRGCRCLHGDKLLPHVNAESGWTLASPDITAVVLVQEIHRMMK